MRKALTLEIWEDETISNSGECVAEIISEAMGNAYCCDGTVDIKIIDNVYEDEDDVKMIQERIKNDNGVRYTINDIETIMKSEGDK